MVLFDVAIWDDLWFASLSVNASSGRAKQARS
jgi:hypothetical protein